MAYKENKLLIEALLACAMECERCATACLLEDGIKMLTKCIQLDRDCTDICLLTAQLLSRGSEHGLHLLKECTEVCHKCAVECEKHRHMDHCGMCAETCKRCAEQCAHLV